MHKFQNMKINTIQNIIKLKYCMKFLYIQKELSYFIDCVVAEAVGWTIKES